MWSSRCRRQVVSEGPLKGPDGTSVTSDAATDEVECVRSSEGAVGRAMGHPESRRRRGMVGVAGKTSGRKGPRQVTSFRHAEQIEA
jgi:hypothetical protein